MTEITYTCVACGCTSDPVYAGLSKTRGLAALGWSRRRFIEDVVVRHILCSACSERYMILYQSAWRDKRYPTLEEVRQAPQEPEGLICTCGAVEPKDERWHRRRTKKGRKALCPKCDAEFIKERRTAAYFLRYGHYAKKVKPSKIDRVKAKELLGSGMTLKDVADVFGVSRERIRQLFPSGSFVRKCSKCGGDVEGRERVCRQCKKQRTYDNHHDYCACGAVKFKIAERCKQCAGVAQRKYDHADAVYLYEHGISGPCIARFYGILDCGLYAVLKDHGVVATHNREIVDDLTIMALLAMKNGTQGRPEVL